MAGKGKRRIMRSLSFEAISPIRGKKKSRSKFIIGATSRSLRNQVLLRQLRSQTQAHKWRTKSTNYIMKPQPIEEIFELHFDQDKILRTTLNTPGKTITQPIESQPMVERHEVHSHEELILRTTLNRQGKKIIFFASKYYKGFQGEISIFFPNLCVLEEENVFLEITPEEIICFYNGSGRTTDKNEKIITPILHVDRENGAPFLKRVTVTLPLVLGAQSWLSGGIRGAPERITYSTGSFEVTITTNKFSDAAVKFCEVTKCLDALGVNDDFSLNYTSLGVYLLVEQLPDMEFKFDFRKLKNWQEHRKFRMDQTKFHCLILNPETVKKEDYGKGIKLFIPEEFLVKNSRGNSHIDGNVVNFWFPNPKTGPDHSNERLVEIRGPRESCSMNLKADYQSTNLSRLAWASRFRVSYIISYEYNQLIQKQQLPDHEMLVNFLSLLGEKWTVYLSDYLGYEIDGLNQFILTDIVSTIGARPLQRTRKNIKKLREVLRNRGYDDFNFQVGNDARMIGDIFRNFRGCLELGRSKREMISLMKASGVVCRTEAFSEGLNLGSREVLASAMMYIPIGNLKKSIHKIYSDRKITARSELVDNFLNMTTSEELANN